LHSTVLPVVPSQHSVIQSLNELFKANTLDSSQLA